MRSCESCGREFTAVRGRTTCPYCGFNNGRGSWPSSDDLAGILACKADDKRFRAQMRRRRRAAVQAQEAIAHA